MTVRRAVLLVALLVAGSARSSLSFPEDTNVTRATLDNVGRLLRAVGLDYQDVVKTTVYLCDMSEFGAMNAIYREYFPVDPPTRATIGVAALAADYRIEIEVIAAR